MSPPVGAARSGVVGARVGDAIPDSDIAQFEDGSLHASFGGATGSWAVNSSSPTLTGTYSLKATADGGGAITSESGLNHYPQTDQRFACYTQTIVSGGSPGVPCVAWGSQDTGNFYEFGYIPANNELLLAIVQSGSFTGLSPRTSVTLSTATWYDLEVEWLSDGSITGRIFDVNQSTGERQGGALASISGSDSTWSSGGLGFNMESSGGRGRYDNYRVLEAL